MISSVSELIISYFKYILTNVNWTESMWGKGRGALSLQFLRPPLSGISGSAPDLGISIEVEVVN